MTGVTGWIGRNKETRPKVSLAWPRCSVSVAQTSTLCGSHATISVWAEMAVLTVHVKAGSDSVLTSHRGITCHCVAHVDSPQAHYMNRLNFVKFNYESSYIFLYCTVHYSNGLLVEKSVPSGGGLSPGMADLEAVCWCHLSFYCYIVTKTHHRITVRYSHSRTHTYAYTT